MGTVTVTGGAAVFYGLGKNICFSRFGVKSELTIPSSFSFRSSCGEAVGVYTNRVRWVGGTARGMGAGSDQLR